MVNKDEYKNGSFSVTVWH